MTECTLVLRPRDPILARDGRPFGADPGAYAESLPWPLPSTLAGALRTHIGNLARFDWNTDGPQKARSIKVYGPLMLAKKKDAAWKCYLPAPHDAVWVANHPQATLMRLMPFSSLPDGAGCDLPHRALLPLRITFDEKPLAGRDYWALDDVAAWLSDPEAREVADYLPALPAEPRVHVSINDTSGTSKEGALFVTVSRCFPDVREHGYPAQVAMLCKVAGDYVPSKGNGAYLPFGGERRIAALEEAAAYCEWPPLPQVLRSATDRLNSQKRLRLQLVTPALFKHGWRPGWLDDHLQGSLPCARDIRLRLVSAAIGRRQAVSGWSLDKRAPGPRPARFMVPAGSVYFFQVVEGQITPDTLSALWLSSIADDEQDRKDGFGLVVPGLWNYAE